MQIAKDFTQPRSSRLATGPLQLSASLMGVLVHGFLNTRLNYQEK